MNINTEYELMESGHGFTIIEREPNAGPDILDMGEDAIPMADVMDPAMKGRVALDYVKWVYFLEGSDAARLIKENEANQGFWDEVEKFYYSF